MTEVERLVNETRPLVEAMGRGEFEKVGWAAIADRLIAIQKADPQLSQATIGNFFGHTQKWVADIVKWRTSKSTSASPFARTKDGSSQQRADTRRQLREAPEVVAPEIARALEDPKVRAAILKTAPDIGLAFIVDRTRKSRGAGLHDPSPPKPTGTPIKTPADPWKYWLRAEKLLRSAFVELDLMHDHFNEDAWNLPPSSVQGFAEVSAELVDKLREAADFLEAIKDVGREYINR